MKRSIEAVCTVYTSPLFSYEVQPGTTSLMTPSRLANSFKTGNGKRLLSAVGGLASTARRKKRPIRGQFVRPQTILQHSKDVD